MEQIKIFSETFSDWSANNVSGLYRMSDNSSFPEAVSFWGRLETMEEMGHGEKTSGKSWIGQCLLPIFVEILGTYSNKFEPPSSKKALHRLYPSASIGCANCCFGAWRHSTVCIYPWWFFIWETVGKEIVVHVPFLIVMTTKEHVAIWTFFVLSVATNRYVFIRDEGFVLTCEEEVQRLVRLPMYAVSKP